MPFVVSLYHGIKRQVNGKIYCRNHKKKGQSYSIKSVTVLLLFRDCNQLCHRPLERLQRQERLFDYVAEKRTNPHTYLDYLKACQNLGLDMSEEKNRFPHDFKRWHDIRIDQYAAKKAMEDAKKRKELYAQFAAVAEKYMSLQHAKRSAFICVIARSPADLIREGEALHHCVGRMNYDQRMVREESLIFFIRNKQEPDTPFVTVEYSIPQKKVLQCYGEHDHKPNEEVLHYVNKVWLPYANRTLKQIAA